MPPEAISSVPDDMEREIFKQIEAGFDEEISFLQDMIRFPTENPRLCSVKPGAEAELQSFIGERLKQRGLDVDIWDVYPKRPDLVGVLKGTGGGRSLILNGHVDVVPVGDRALWEIDPWGAEIRDGKVWGRGAVDMKGGIAAMIAAMEAIQRCGLKLKGDLLVNTVIDEETGGDGTRAALDRGYGADAVIVAEPTDLNIQSVEGGLEWLRVIVRGVAGHTAFRYKTVHAGGQGKAINAIEKMMKVLNAVMELERHWGVYKVHPQMPKGITTINIGVILGGTGGGKDGMPNAINTPSTFPDYCSASLSLKYLPNEKTEDVKAEFEDYIQRVAQADPWLRDHPPDIEWGIGGVAFPPVEVLPEHPLIQAVSRAHREVAGEPNYPGFEAVTDLAWFAGRGIPGFMYGPGPINTAHTVNECVSLDELRSCTKVLALTIADWCSWQK
jgi:acetylornithine deacetylase/succinyl-diaminopimelate desuccinylase family protein